MSLMSKEINLDSLILAFTAVAEIMKFSSFTNIVTPLSVMSSNLWKHLLF